MNQVAVVTGASYGLGEAICKQLLVNQFKIYGISRTQPSIKNSQFFWFKADLTSSADIASVSTFIKERSIDILINNAGTAFEKPALDFTDDDFEKMYTLNFKTPIKLTQALFPKLSHGIIINISSISDRYPDPMYGLYASTKAALNIYFETIASENTNVKVINLLPSYIDTPLQHKLNDDNKGFDWNMPMKSDQVATVIPYIIADEKRIETGSRVLVVSTSMGNLTNNPEKLWVFNVDNQKMDLVT